MATYQDVDSCFMQLEDAIEAGASQKEIIALEDQCWLAFEDQIEEIDDLAEINDAPVQIYIPQETPARAIPETTKEKIQEQVQLETVAITGPGAQVTFKGVGFEFTGAAWIFLAAFCLAVIAWFARPILLAYFSKPKAP